MTSESPQTDKAIIGCILGTAVGDALGLPCEGLPKKRLKRLHPRLDGHGFFLRRGMTSDDTEHTVMVAQSLIASAGETRAFSRDFSKRLRLWLLAVPAGCGLATLKAALK